MIQYVYCIYQKIKRVNGKYDRVFAWHCMNEEEAKRKVKELSKKFKDLEFYYEKEENIIFDKIE